MSKKIKITQAVKPEKEVPAEIMAQAIVEISTGIKKLLSGRLDREVIVTLIHDRSKVAKRDIRIVMTNLVELEKNFLK